MQLGVSPSRCSCASRAWKKSWLWDSSSPRGLSGTWPKSSPFISAAPPPTPCSPQRGGRDAHRPLARRGRRHLEVSYSSGGLCAGSGGRDLPLAPVTSTLTLNPDRPPLMDRLPDAQSVFQATGGTPVALASPDGSYLHERRRRRPAQRHGQVIGAGPAGKAPFRGIGSLLSGRVGLRDGPEAARAGLPLLAQSPPPPPWPSNSPRK